MSPRADALAAVSDRTFGSALRLTDVAPGSRLGMDLVLTDGSSGVDLELTRGGDTVGQALKVALLTPTGSDLFHARFGFDGLRVLAMDVDPGLVQDFLELAVVRAVGLDRRVRRVLDVEMEPLQGEEGRRARRWKVAAEVQTILGDVARMTLGEVAVDG